MEKSNALSVQVGGQHYKSGAIQPIEFYVSNPHLGFPECNVIKYIYRHKDKKGLEDLLKVVHYTMFAAEYGYSDGNQFIEQIYDLIQGSSIYESRLQDELQKQEILNRTEAGPESFLHQPTEETSSSDWSGFESYKKSGSVSE